MIQYRVNDPISTEDFIDILNRSTLGERRPLEDRACMEAMVRHGNLCVTAWDGDLLVGLARSVTDFHYACYLSELAVDSRYQKGGIGKALIHHTKAQLGPHCWLTLIAAPAARDYYPHIGLERNPDCWEQPPAP
ncbi:GNAT family N-acetyltransferase [Gallaecimonas kandeliae]|uniref:GNAT family N-acetyltransferase n=1 Tax=Gallaecimonas kandeliae TaxID=3029055 RepID=UPI003010012B